MEAVNDRSVKSKKYLKSVRLSKQISAEKMAKAVGISRRQYIDKEDGIYAFKDYEMLIISNYLKVPIQKLFFE